MSADQTYLNDSEAACAGFHFSISISVFVFATACELSAFTAGFFAYAQIYTLTGIAMERAVATRSRKVTAPTIRTTLLKLLVIWSLS